MTVEKQAMSINEQKLGALMGQVVNDIGAIMSAGLITLGDNLGLYRALAEHGPATPAELAERSGIGGRYLHEWLLNQATVGYVDYEAATGLYSLSPEQELIFANRESPLFLAELFGTAPDLLKAAQEVTEAFRFSTGLAWGEHNHGLFEGQYIISRAGMLTELPSIWIPALTGVQTKLQAGATVADVGCGYGLSTITLARTFPNSRFYGYDSHPLSIEKARKLAEEAGVSDRVTFEIATASNYPARRYDFISFIDSFHDMGRSTEVLEHAYKSLIPGGTLMLVEPAAGDKTEDNFNPVGRIFSGGSILICVPNALSQGGPALGAFAPDATYQEMTKGAGFSGFRRVATTGFNRVMEAHR